VENPLERFVGKLFWSCYAFISELTFIQETSAAFATDSTASQINIMTRENDLKKETPVISTFESPLKPAAGIAVLRGMLLALNGLFDI